MENIKSTKALTDAEKLEVEVMRQGLKYLASQQKHKILQVKITPKFVQLNEIKESERTFKAELNRKGKTSRRIEHIKTVKSISDMIHYVDNLANQQKLGYRKIVK